MLKVVFIIFLIILGLVINLGGIPGVPRRGFQYWNHPGPFVEYIGKGDWGKATIVFESNDDFGRCANW